MIENSADSISSVYGTRKNIHDMIVIEAHLGGRTVNIDGPTVGLSHSRPREAEPSHAEWDTGTRSDSQAAEGLGLCSSGRR